MSDEPNQQSITIKEIVTLTMRVETLLALAEKHEKTIYGNGNEEKSVLYRLAQLEQAEKQRKELEQQRGKDLRSVLTPIVTTAITWVLAALAFVIAGHAMGILH